MSDYPSINELARDSGIPYGFLRKQLADGLLPGFYCGNRFRVNRKLFFEKLDRESRAAMGECVERTEARAE